MCGLIPSIYGGFLGGFIGLLIPLYPTMAWYPSSCHLPTMGLELFDSFMYLSS